MGEGFLSLRKRRERNAIGQSLDLVPQLSHFVVLAGFLVSLLGYPFKNLDRVPARGYDERSRVFGREAQSTQSRHMGFECFDKIRLLSGFGSITADNNCAKQGWRHKDSLVEALQAAAPPLVSVVARRTAGLVVFMFTIRIRFRL
jgi:hypothetical protein